MLVQAITAKFTHASRMSIELFYEALNRLTEGILPSKDDLLAGFQEVDPLVVWNKSYSQHRPWSGHINILETLEEQPAFARFLIELRYERQSPRLDSEGEPERGKTTGQLAQRSAKLPQTLLNLMVTCNNPEVPMPSNQQAYSLKEVQLLFPSRGNVSLASQTLGFYKGLLHSYGIPYTHIDILVEGWPEFVDQWHQTRSIHIHERNLGAFGWRESERRYLHKSEGRTRRG